jgi:hypothetical protein
VNPFAAEICPGFARVVVVAASPLDCLLTVWFATDFALRLADFGCRVGGSYSADPLAVGPASAGVEIGAGWRRTGKTSGEDYVSLGLADPAFGPKNLYANLGRAAGQDDENLYAVIWNPAD